MRAGIFFLVLGYFLSQFYRSFLAVLAPLLGTELGATAADLSYASALWFFVFAAMQIPVGWALDRFGPKWTASLLLSVGGIGGAVVFATATGPGAVQIAMALFGVAGAPILMASYFIFARVYPLAMFSTLGGAMIGFGSAGNLVASVPLAYLVEAIGWRQTMWGLAVAALLVALALLLILKDPPKAVSEPGQNGSLLSLLKNRNFLLLLPLMLVNYAPSAGIRGLWAGPYLGDIYGLDQIGIGRATLIMAIAMALGNFAYGPMERIFNSKKRVVLVGNLIAAAMCFLLWAFPSTTWLFSAVLFAAIGFFGASFPVLMAHGKMFMPAHLTGRGITLLNLFGVGGVALMQFVTGKFAKMMPPEYSVTPEFYGRIFLMFGLTLLAGCAVYVFSREERAR